MPLNKKRGVHHPGINFLFAIENLSFLFFSYLPQGKIVSMLCVCAHLAVIFGQEKLASFCWHFVHLTLIWSEFKYGYIDPRLTNDICAQCLHNPHFYLVGQCVL